MNTIELKTFNTATRASLKKASTKKETITITNNGIAVGRVVPMPAVRRNKLKSLRGMVKILGDVVSPIFIDTYDYKDL